ncbi:phage distal tail protein [Streptomyces sp. CB02923]|uniref:phage distal tail protein n=1 Tax=Streptomyces sp. CB02923 TaxID=1718985 RepID=UPI0018FF3D13|nr:phage tail domain-containing protein [Streptomyces sp. CB02923]
MTVPSSEAIGRIQWGDMLFGPGTPYGVEALLGIDDLPDVRGDDSDRPNQHGTYSGPDYTGARVIQLGLAIRGDDPTHLRALKMALRAATQPGQTPAPLQLLDWDLLAYGKVRKRSIPYDAHYLWRVGEAAIEWYCPDPRLYSLAEHTASTTAYSPAAGRTYPLTFPRSYGDAGSAGRITAYNGGSAEAYPVLRIDGPVAAPVIEHTTGTLTFTAAAVLRQGEYLVIDTRARAVLLMGSAPRRDWVQGGSRWPVLAPGPTEIAFRGAALPGASGQSALLTVTWRDTSL